MVKINNFLFTGLCYSWRRPAIIPSTRGEWAMDERKLLGQRVKHLRRLKGYTQEQLAERIEINPKYLSSIERGAENPTLDLLRRLAKGLQVDLYELFQFQEGVPPGQLRRKV